MKDPKDFWDRLLVIATGVSALIAVLAYIRPGGPDQSRLDADLMTKFRDTYYRTAADPAADSARRFAPYVIDRISSPCLREAIRRFAVWDILERNIVVSHKPSPQPPFRFDSEHSDWHLLGDILLSMRDDDQCSHDFRRWWEQDVKGHTRDLRWPVHAGELSALYAWLESVYIGPLGTSRRNTFWLESLLVQSLVLIFIGILAMLLILVAHRLILWWRFHAFLPRQLPPSHADTSHRVLVQLPMYNEQHVASRVIHAAARLDWPRDRLHIQVLDDSTDSTSGIVQNAVVELQAQGIDVHHLRRDERTNYKAGALAYGLEQAMAVDLVCIFDADFLPPPDFLTRATIHFSDPSVGVVQARWTHTNETHSLLTRLQALMLDGHFVVDHEGRHRSGCFFNFNGTAGIWRRSAIEDAGGWQGDTLTEDLDISYRAQVRGWKFVYRPDIVAPCELPQNMLGLKAQQRRWSRGSLQTAQKLLRGIWCSRVSIRHKLEATAHLLANTGYVMVFAAGWLLLPVHFYGGLRDWRFVFDLELALLSLGFLATGLFFWTAGRFVGRRRVTCLLSVVPIMLFGMGMSANNGIAAISGLLAKRGTFVRTPKYGTERCWWRTPYGTRQPLGQLFGELLFFVYLCVSVVVTWQYVAPTGVEAWRALVFPIAFSLGVGYVVIMTCVHLALQGRE